MGIALLGVLTDVGMALRALAPEQAVDKPSQEGATGLSILPGRLRQGDAGGMDVAATIEDTGVVVSRARAPEADQVVVDASLPRATPGSGKVEPSIHVPESAASKVLDVADKTKKVKKPKKRQGDECDDIFGALDREKSGKKKKKKKKKAGDEFDDMFSSLM
jgi:ribonuclease MRP protein subunit RMP1